jgi:cation diffusion facilitator CzcD-associated flavoprotein CzcO
MSKRSNVCIIGAGSSGLVAAKIFHENGIPFDCFEMSDRVGGNWVFGNPNGVSSAYRSLHINSSHDRTCFSDFPMPEDYPDFPHHTLIARYFESYLDHFGFRDKITFNTEVTRAAPAESGGWVVELDGDETRNYNVLCVANGHHWDPHWPDPPFRGRFDGSKVHSHHYVDPTTPIDCVGKNVVIVGMGNSALDIACELGRKGVSRSVYLSVRRGYWVIPKYVLGQPMDRFYPHPKDEPNLLLRWLPYSLRYRLIGLGLKLLVGDPRDYGMPQPDHPFGATHPTVSSEINLRLGSGDVVIKPSIAQLDERKIRFADGSVEDVDVIIYATGYNISFPFFDRDFLYAADNEFALFHRVMHLEHPNLFFIGLVQPWCSIMPIAEAQSEWIAQLITGDYLLPSRERIEAETMDYHEREKSRYVRSPRHTIQIDCVEYMMRLRKDLRRGVRAAARARKQAIHSRTGVALSSHGMVGEAEAKVPDDKRG